MDAATLTPSATGPDQSRANTTTPVAGSVLAEITDILRSVLDDPDLVVTEATVASDVPGWDSMAHIAVVVETESRFGITFHAAEIEGLHRLGDLIRVIETKRAAA